MKRLNLLKLSIVAIWLSGIVCSASAQPDKTNPLAFQLIAIHHVPSDVMAYWLDPAHHPAPANFKKQLDAERPEASAIIQDADSAPKGVKTTIISITSPLNALLVYADKTTFAHLLQKVTALDKPIPGIEFEAKSVEVSNVAVSKNVINTNSNATDANTLEWQQIPIKNIRPSMLAYWIDPAHYPKPAEYIKADSYLRELLPKRAQELPQTIPMENKTSANRLGKPIGTTIFADDSDKVIWVRGTKNQCEQLTQIVDFLDHPISKIDIDFKLIEMNSADDALIQSKPILKSLYDSSPKQRFFNAKVESMSTLTDLIKNGKATIVKSSQLTILNNLTDRYTTANSTPVTINIKQSDSGDQILSTETDKDNPLLMEKRLSMIFTPTINNDDTITLFMTIGANATLTHKASTSDDQLWIKKLDQNKGFMTTVATVKNGDSIVLGGFNSTSLGLDNENQPIVLWVKAEIEK